MNAREFSVPSNKGAD